MKKAYIWDLDGTLLDSYTVIVDSLYETYREFGFVLEKEMIHEHTIKYSVSSFIKSMEEKTGKSFESMKDRYSEISGEMKSNIGLINNATWMLQALADRGDDNFVYTHRGVSTQSVLERLGIKDYFKEIVTSQSGFARKPAPDGVNYLVEKYGLDRANTYYVGDRTIDMDCAKNAGVKGILYLEEGSYTEPNGSETYIVRNLADIPGL